MHDKDSKERTDYYISKYIEVVKNKNDYILFNKMNGSIVSFNEDSVVFTDDSYFLRGINQSECDFLKNYGFFDSEDLIRAEIKKLNEGTFISDDVHITISVTESCNLDCSYCYQKNWNKNDSIDKSTYKNMLIDYVYFVVETFRNKKAQLDIHFIGGEPLCERRLIEELTQEILQIREMRAYSKIEFNFRMDTNLTLIDERFIRSFPNLEICTALSMPEDHNALRSNSYNDVIKKLLEIKDVFLEENYHLSIRYNVHSGNQNDLDKFLELFSHYSIVCEIEVQNLINEGQTYFMNSLSDDRFEEKYVNEYISILHRFGYETDILPKSGIGRHCYGQNVLSCKFYSNGQRVLCDAIPKSDGFSNQHFTVPFIEKLPEKCINCYDFPYCGGEKPCEKSKCNGIYSKKAINRAKIKQYAEMCESVFSKE